MNKVSTKNVTGNHSETSSYGDILSTDSDVVSDSGSDSGMDVIDDTSNPKTVGAQANPLSETGDNINNEVDNDIDNDIDNEVDSAISKVIDEIARNAIEPYSDVTDDGVDNNADDSNVVNDVDNGDGDISDNHDDNNDNNDDDSESDIEDLIEDDEHSKETTQKVNSICETEYCNEMEGVEGVSLKALCDAEGDGVFERLKKYVEDSDPVVVRRDMQRLMTSVADADTIDGHTFEILLILKTYKRLKTMENACLEYKNDFEKYSKYVDEYQKKRDFAKVVREANLRVYNGEDSLDKSSIDSPKKSSSKSSNKSSNKSSSKDSNKDMLRQILTPHKINQEMLTYELLFYRPDVQILFTEDKLADVAVMIQQILNRFNPIIQSRLEDHSWTINYKDTLNFAVKKGRVIMSNTIRTDDESNTLITTHLDMLRSYLRRVFKVKSVNYKIVEDNKFYFSWIFIEIGYSPKKQVGN